MSNRIVLIGHRGSGKTTHGRALATALGRPFVDLDAEIARAAGGTVSELFAHSGEAGFRTREWATFQALGREPGPVVVALGGGFPVEQLNGILQREDIVIWLRRSSDGLPRPFEGRPRLYPQLAEPEEWARLYDERTPRYAAAATLVWDVADGEVPETTAQRFLFSNPRLAPAFQVHAVQPFRWSGVLPASKSELQRAFILAAQADQPIAIAGTSRCDDVRVLMTALQHLGVTIHERKGGWEVVPPGGGLADRGNHGVEINVGASGAVLRFLIPLLAKARGTFTLCGTPRLHERPLAPLLDAVRRLGGRVACLNREGYLSVRVTGPGFGTVPAGAIPLDVSQSSQFASALLLAAIGLPEGLRLDCRGTARSRPYLAMTLDLLRQCGINTTAYVVPPNARVEAASIAVEADASSAAALLAGAAIAGEATIRNYPRLARQADRVFLHHLRQIGAGVEERQATVRVTRRTLRPFTIDCGDCPDLAPVLAVLATFAHGTSRIAGAPQLRWKESDRIGDMATELQKVGARIEIMDDGFVVHGAPSGITAAATPLDPHDDHRLAMALPLLAFHGRPVTILHPGVVTKSFPEFWLTLVTAGIAITPFPL